MLASFFMLHWQLMVLNRASNSSRNSWTSNIEYLANKYSNSLSISNSTNTTKDGRFWAPNSWFLTILPWILKQIKNNLCEQFTIVEIMYFCKNSVKPICVFVLFLFTPHFTDSTQKFTWNQHIAVSQCGKVNSIKRDHTQKISVKSTL